MSSINNRNTPRLERQPKDSWQISINNDELITRNIVDISPTGLAFKAPARAQFGYGQKVKLFVQLAPQRYFECEGKIVWEKNQRYGLHFSKIPQYFDAWIMKAINELSLQNKQVQVAYNGAAFSNARQSRTHYRAIEKNEFLHSVLGLALIGVMTAAFLMAAFMTQQNYPEYKLSNIVERAFEKRLHGPGK